MSDTDSGSVDEAPVLDAYDLASGYAGSPVWSQVDVTLYAGEVAFLVGPNGAGKTTLLKCLAGWMNPTAGEVRICGERMDGASGALRTAISFVPDVPAFYDDLTAGEHIEFVLRARRLRGERHAEAEDLLRRFGIWEARDAFPQSFSRGMRQKLALIIALINHPRLLLLDEPTGPLDPASRELLGALIRSAVDAGTAVLMSCHHDLPGVTPDVVFKLDQGSVCEVEGYGLGA